MYWNRNTQINPAALSMDLNWYLTLRANLHVNSQQQAPEGETCHFWKVTHITEALGK